MDGGVTRGGLSALFTHSGGFLLTRGRDSELLLFARLTCNMQIFVRLWLWAAPRHKSAAAKPRPCRMWLLSAPVEQLNACLRSLGSRTAVCFLNLNYCQLCWFEQLSSAFLFSFLSRRETGRTMLLSAGLLPWADGGHLRTSERSGNMNNNWGAVLLMATDLRKA